MARRFLAQRATTKEWIATDLPITDARPTWELSGVGSLTGTIQPDQGFLTGSDGLPVLQDWGTLLYMEDAGVIRWGGILLKSTFEGQQWQIEAAGFSTYPHGIPYDDTYSHTSIDPAQVVKDLWAYVQGKPDGDLGVVVDGTTSVRIGTETESKEETVKDSKGLPVKDKDGHVVKKIVTSTIPYKLDWWDTHDVGSEIDSLAQATPFDWVESHRWNDTKTDVLHRVTIGYPRVGRRRDDLMFVQGQNILSLIPATMDGDDFANEVLGIGAGEGSKAVRASTAVRDGRLRRVAVLDAKDVTSTRRLQSLVDAERAARAGLLAVEKITIRDHPNAQFGAFQVGDDITVQARLPWLGRVNVRSRITSWTQTSDTTADLTLKRSDSYTYGG